MDQIKYFVNSCSDDIPHCIINVVAVLVFILSFTSKFPQIASIYKNGSTQGISTFSIYADCITSMFKGLYCFHKGVNKSILAEYLNLSFQNLIILILSWKYAKTNSNKMFKFLFVFFFCLFCFFCIFYDSTLPESFWSMLASMNVPTTSISRFSQIYTIIKSKNVLSLSLLSFNLRFLKNFLEFFIIFLETGIENPIMLFNEFYSGVLNIVLIILIGIYKMKKEKKH